MKSEDLTRFVDTIQHHGQSDTLRGTMVDLFGQQQGTIYTNGLMDHLWRVENASGQSVLFTTALDHGLPTSVADS